jgi:hypothetical protein
MSRKLPVAVLTLVLAGWLLQGCGQSVGKMTPATASTLQRDVAAVVSAIEASRWEAAIDALDQLEADVASAQAAGGLSDERATQIRAVQQRVLEDLQRIRRSSPTPGPATATQTTPSTKTDDNRGNGDENDDHGDNDGENEDGGNDDHGDNGGENEDGGNDDHGDYGGENEDGGNDDHDGKSNEDDQGEEGSGKHKGKEEDENG